MARFLLLFREQSRIFDGNAGLACEHAQQFEMALIEHPLFPAMDHQHSDRAVV